MVVCNPYTLDLVKWLEQLTNQWITTSAKTKYLEKKNFNFWLLSQNDCDSVESFRRLCGGE